MSDRQSVTLSADEWNVISRALQDRVDWYLRVLGPNGEMDEFIAETQAVEARVSAQRTAAALKRTPRATPGTIRVRRTWTFTVDTSAWACEYGVSPASVREDFNSMCDQFDEAECFTSAWPGLVTNVHVHTA